MDISFSVNTIPYYKIFEIRYQRVEVLYHGTHIALEILATVLLWTEHNGEAPNWVPQGLASNGDMMIFFTDSVGYIYSGKP